MRELGFDVEGIDTSAGQVRFAVHKLGDEVVRVGSVLDIPYADATFDFLFNINVLHHLKSVAEQAAGPLWSSFECLNRVGCC